MVSGKTVVSVAAGGAVAVTALNAVASARRPALPSPVEAAPEMLGTGDGVIRLYERGSGPPVVLLHSFNAAGTAFEVRPLFERLSRDRRVVTFDWLGFGLSQRPGRLYTAQFYRRLLRGVLDEIEPGPVDVVALSLPSQYVVLQAMGAPGRFRRLALISPTGFGRFARRPGWGAAVAVRLLRLPVVGPTFFNALTLRPVVRRFLRSTFANPGLLPAGYEWYAWATTRQPGARFAPASFVTGLLDDPAAPDAYVRLPVPTLMLFGDHPRFCDPDAARALAARNPWLDVRVIPDCGDLPQFEQPAAAFEMIDAFLGARSPAG